MIRLDNTSEQSIINTKKMALKDKLLLVMIASVGGGGSLAVRFPKRSEVCFHRVVITYNLLHNTSVVTYYLLKVYVL